jgi:uncharacterized repeat protein (TIGR01451 family)
MDLEYEGNEDWCPTCFPPYDQDECFNDSDAGLMMPEAFTIDSTGSVTPCLNTTSGGTPLGSTCQIAAWGTNVDIRVINRRDDGAIVFANVLMDWNQDGQWGGSSVCRGLGAMERVLFNFPIPNGYDGPLSALGPPNFLIGPNVGYVWARFSITERRLLSTWDGSGSYLDGETEDYLLKIVRPPQVEVTKRLVEPASGLATVSDTITYTIHIENTGPSPVSSLPLWDYYSPACLRFTSWSVYPLSADVDLGVVHWDNVLDGPGPGVLLPGHTMAITVDFHTHITDTMYWKEAGWMDYAPKGMPDIDQKQDEWYESASGKWYYCGPVAAANSLWWFDSKFEPSPVPPPALNDGYGLVQSYSPSGWDDHDPLNVQRFVTALAVQMGTSAFTGTNVHNLASGIANYINSKGLAGQYTVHREPKPLFGWVEKEVRRSEDVILLLGFWQPIPGTPNYERVGGHYVTVAGIDSRLKRIAFSDPYYNRAEMGGAGRVLPNPHLGLHPFPGPISDTVHNDVKHASHDVYGIMDTNSPGGDWGPEDYAATCDDIWDLHGQNEGDHPNTAPCEPGLPIYTEVEYAVAVSPITPTLLCKPTDNIAVVSGGFDVSGVKVPEAQGHARVKVNQKPTLGTVKPPSGSGPTGVITYFVTSWHDANGWADLKQCYFHIGDSPDIVGNVTLLYNSVKDKLWIRSDDGSMWLGGFAPGSMNSMENSQAKVHCDLSMTRKYGNTVEVTWAIEFKPGYTGNKKTGLKCKDRDKARAKAKWKGTWTIF